MFDAHPFLALVEVTDDFTSEAFAQVAAERNAPTQETQDVGAAKGGHRMVEQSRVEAAQCSGLAEDDVDRPLTLIGRPVVRRWMSLEDLVVDRIQRPSDTVQQRRPLDFSCWSISCCAVGQSSIHGKQLS